MSLNDILGSALSGLTAAQAGLATVSNNIANVNTPGYARERLTQSAAVTAGRVSGVVVGDPTRVADQFLESTVYSRAGDLGAAQASSNYLDQLQSLLGAAGSSSSLTSQIDAISTAAVALASPPPSVDKNASLVSSVQSAINSFQQLGTAVGGLRGQVDSAVSDTTQQVNSLLGQISKLNDTIVSQQAIGRGSAGAESQRTAALDQLGSLVQIAVRPQSDGRVAIDTASGVALLDRQPRQLVYTPTAGGSSAIQVRFTDAGGATGAATGETISSSAVGGRLGGLLDVRDRALPAFSDKLGQLFGAMAQSLNAASNAATTAPAPATLTGRHTALSASDALNFTGAATFSVTSSGGSLVTSARIDFAALGPAATVGDAVNAINTGLGGAATASFTNGALSITTKGSGTGNGIVVTQDASNPSARGGVGFSQYFGLNDMVTSGTAPLVPSGFTASDPTGFATGQTMQLALRDSSGRQLASYDLKATSGQTFGNMVDTLNSSPLASYGSFAMDAQGRVAFQPTPGATGASLAVVADSTNRYGSGQSFSALTQLGGASSGLDTAAISPVIASNPANLPLAQLTPGAANGAIVLGAADTGGAAAYSDALTQPGNLGANGTTSVSNFAAQLLSGAGADAASADRAVTTATGQHDDAVNRRNSFSGVNIDEELANMVSLQNSYSASARVMTTANKMYDTLITMVG